MAFKAAFIFVAPEVDPKTAHTVVKTPGVELSVVGVGDYAQAEIAAAQLVRDGIGMIELCAGFGHDGVARIVKAVEGKIPVGVVRFDLHPGLGHKSGDSLF